MPSRPKNIAVRWDQIDPVLPTPLNQRNAMKVNGLKFATDPFPRLPTYPMRMPSQLGRHFVTGRKIEFGMSHVVLLQPSGSFDGKQGRSFVFPQELRNLQIGVGR